MATPRKLSVRLKRLAGISRIDECRTVFWKVVCRVVRRLVVCTIHITTPPRSPCAFHIVYVSVGYLTITDENDSSIGNLFFCRIYR